MHPVRALGSRNFEDVAQDPARISVIGGGSLLQPVFIDTLDASQRLANTVATFSVGTGTDPATLGLRQMLVDGECAGGQAHVSNHKAQVRTKYMLLEKVASTLNCAPWAITQVTRVQSTEPIHSKIKPVLKATHRWPGIFKVIRDHLARESGASGSTVVYPPPQAWTGPQQSHLRTLKLLDGVLKSASKSDYYVVEANVQMAAFMVHWHSTVGRHGPLISLRD